MNTYLRIANLYEFTNTNVGRFGGKCAVLLTSVLINPYHHLLFVKFKMPIRIFALIRYS